MEAAEPDAEDIDMTIAEQSWEEDFRRGRAEGLLEVMELRFGPIRYVPQ